MTNKITALRAMEKAVDDGLPWFGTVDILAAKVFGLRYGQTCDEHDWMRDANQGSLDAAKELHDVLLPKWGWIIGSGGSATLFPPDHLKIKGVMGPTPKLKGNPARAWLLAIIRAMIAKEGVE